MQINKKKHLAKKYVVQRNDLIYGKTNVFTVTDLKIFKLIISKVNSKSLLFDDFYEITKDELKAININQKHLYTTTKDSLKKLASVYVKIETDDMVREVGLIKNDFKMPKYSDKIYISFNDDMKEYLLDIQQNYTKYAIEEISDLKLKHSLKLYEYLKSISFETVEIRIEKLKERLDIESSSYAEFGSFKRSVLVPVLEEINHKTKLQVKFEPIKEGRKIEKLKFFIRREENKTPAPFIQMKQKEDKFTPYIGKQFNYQNEEFKIIRIDKNSIMAEVENILTNEIGTLSAASEYELLDQLDLLISGE